MTQPTSSQLQEAPPNREFEWVVEMPPEIAEMFGVPADLPVRLRALPGHISAQMDLTEQTDEARGKEPGWFIELPAAAAAISGFATDSFIGIYAKAGTTYVEMIAPSPALDAAADRLYRKYKDVFEELQRLGD